MQIILDIDDDSIDIFMQDFEEKFRVTANVYERYTFPDILLSGVYNAIKNNKSMLKFSKLSLQLNTCGD